MKHAKLKSARQRALALVAAAALLGGSSTFAAGAFATGGALAQDSVAFTRSGSNTNVQLKLHSVSGTQTVQALTVAVRDQWGDNLDYQDAFNLSIGAGGYTFTSAKAFSSGSYSMFGAYEINGVWTNFTSNTVNVPVANQVALTSLTENASGANTEAKLTVHSGATYSQVAQELTVAVRDQFGNNLDYLDQPNVLITPAGYTFDETKSLANGTYTMFGAYMMNGAWVNLPSQQVTVPVGGGGGGTGDTIAPTVPTGLTVGSPTSTSLGLSWNASSDNGGGDAIAGYDVYRNGVKVGTSTGTTYTDTGLTASTQYSYTVDAFDQAGNVSAKTSAVSGTTAAGTGGGTNPNGPGGTWNLKFDDEFSGTSVDTSKWSFQSSAESDWSSNPLGTGNPGNQQLEFDTPNNCSVANGALNITSKPDSITSQNGNHYNWSSCMLNTSPSYAFQYGYMEERAQLPNQKGFWPAFWTWGSGGGSCSANGETDAYEFYSDNHSNLYLTQHQGSGGSTVYNPPFDPSGGYHTYGVDLEPNGTTFYIDGVNVYSTGATQSCSANILLDNFVYSQIPPNAGTTEHKMVDYVRAWQH